MLRTQTRVQPTGGTIVELLHAALDSDRYHELDAAVAYVTMSGLEALRGSNPDAVNHLSRRWLTSFDWCRSDPVALRGLNQGGSSSVRIHDGANVVRKAGCQPSRPFHPKGFLFQGPGARLLISGSGNLSRSGITRGVELDTVIEVVDPAGQQESAVWDALEGVRASFEDLWTRSSACSNTLLSRYESCFEESAANPPRTDDDWSQTDPTPRGFSEVDLVRIRRSNVFWIESGNLTENLGKGNPGSQLMMKALTRVFFGIAATDRPRQTLLGQVDIRYGGSTIPGLSLEYAHNRMDRLNLPHPGHPGPPAYDQRTLVFTKIARQGRVVFDLRLAEAAERAELRRRSAASLTSFTMSGGRRFGFCPT